MSESDDDCERERSCDSLHIRQTNLVCCCIRVAFCVLFVADLLHPVLQATQGFK
jgi:hypothetical protein